MDHVAIMKKSWGLTQKILTGEKKIESRWYKTRRVPWDRIKVGDSLYFKDSGDPVTIQTEVERVLQLFDLTPSRVKEILDTYGKDDGIEKERMQDFFERFKDKKYCILVFLKNPRRIQPFYINKAGFGAMSAWIIVPTLAVIKKG